MGRLTERSAVEEEELSNDKEFSDKSLHEMDTQVIGGADEGKTDNTSFLLSEGRRTRSKNVKDTPKPDPSLLSPQTEGRRTRSGKSLGGEEVANPKTEKRRTPRSIKSKKEATRSSLKTPKILDKTKAVESTSSSSDADNRSRKSGDSIDVDNRDENDALKNDDNEKKDEKTVPLADFMANLNVSPSSNKEEKMKPSEPESASEQQGEKSSNECPEALKSITSSEVTTGKLRSSIADAEGMALARNYRKSLQETEEFALNYISQEFHHPVISCFREITRSDISVIVGNNKLKKSCNTLEQSIVYLGLIDLLATINHNPVYGETETSKLSKNVSGVVNKILVEFKNIMGTWALSHNDQLIKRYSLIISYLRNLIPMFKKANFDVELSNNLDCIEREVMRHKQNQEKIKSMSSSSKGVENSIDKKLTSTDSQDGESRSALNEIVLNVDLNVKLDDSDDEEDISVLKVEQSLKIFGKPLKGSPKSVDIIKKKTKKPKGTLDFKYTESFQSPTNQQNNEKAKTPKTPLGNNKTTLPQPKTLSKVFQHDAVNTTASKAGNNPGTTPPAKKRANDDITDKGDPAKKRKLEGGRVNTTGNGKSSIKNFFQSKTVPSSSSADSIPSPKTDKPKLNAFAIMMNRSREIAQKKKDEKLDAVSVPSLHVKP